MRYKKCVICGEPILSEEDSIPYKEKKHAHIKCFDLNMKILGNQKQEKLAEKAEEKQKKSKTKTKIKPVTELKDGLTDEEYNEKMLVVNYAKQILEVETLPTSFFAILNNNMTKYGHTYIGIYQTLKYLNEIEKRDLVDNPLGLVPFYYDKALDFYKEIERVEADNKDKDISKMYKEKIVYIQPRKREVKQLPFD